MGVVKLANPNRAKKDQRVYERSMWKNGKKKKKQTNKNWTKSVPQAQGSDRELFVRKNQFSDRSVRSQKFCLFVFSYFSDHAETKL